MSPSRSTTDDNHMSLGGGGGGEGESIYKKGRDAHREFFEIDP